MRYKQIVKGKFHSRPNRFIANVFIEDKMETVHVKNTGRCKELLLPGADVILEAGISELLIFLCYLVDDFDCTPIGF